MKGITSKTTGHGCQKLPNHAQKLPWDAQKLPAKYVVKYVLKYVLSTAQNKKTFWTCVLCFALKRIFMTKSKRATVDNAECSNNELVDLLRRGLMVRWCGVGAMWISTSPNPLTGSGTFFHASAILRYRHYVTQTTLWFKAMAGSPQDFFISKSSVRFLLKIRKPGHRSRRGGPYHPP